MITKQTRENEVKAYKKLRRKGYVIETSEGYIPIDLRKYMVMLKHKIIFEGNIEEFIKFAEKIK